MIHKLTIFDEKANVITSADDNKEITKNLNKVGVRFEQWEASFPVTKDHSADEILNAYKKEIDKLIEEKSYQSYDVISLSATHPDKDTLRQKFITEHRHSEDEVRFFVNGKGLFILHIGEKVYSVLCEKGDLISVPAMTPHWFDMGAEPEFTAIRLFNNPDGWIARYTESGIDKSFPTL